MVRDGWRERATEYREGVPRKKRVGEEKREEERRRQMERLGRQGPVPGWRGQQDTTRRKKDKGKDTERRGWTC